MLCLLFFDYFGHFEVVDEHCISFLSRDMAVSKSQFGIATGIEIRFKIA